MAHRHLMFSTGEIHRTVEDDDARVVACLRHRPGLLPDAARRIKPQNLGERRLLRLRLAAEYVDAPAVHRRTSSSARFDRRTRTPAIARQIVDLDITKISGAAASANRVKLS